MENANMTTNDIGEKKENRCKKLNLQMIFNIIFLLGIIGCFILIFISAKTSSKEKNANGLKIGFVNSDSLMVQYDLFFDLKTELEMETQKLRDDLSQKEQNLQNQYVSYQKKMQSGNISFDDAKRTEEQLSAQQQQLMQQGELYTNQIAQKEYAMTLRVLDSINVVIAFVNEAESYDYILGYSQGAGILYANPKHEITDRVVGILNERYGKNKMINEEK